MAGAQRARRHGPRPGPAGGAARAAPRPAAANVGSGRRRSCAAQPAVRVGSRFNRDVHKPCTALPGDAEAAGGPWPGLDCSSENHTFGSLRVVWGRGSATLAGLQVYESPVAGPALAAYGARSYEIHEPIALAGDQPTSERQKCVPHSCGGFGTTADISGCSACGML